MLRTEHLRRAIEHVSFMRTTCGTMMRRSNHQNQNMYPNQHPRSKTHNTVNVGAPKGLHASCRRPLLAMDPKFLLSQNVQNHPLPSPKVHVTISLNLKLISFSPPQTNAPSCHPLALILWSVHDTMFIVVLPVTYLCTPSGCISQGHQMKMTYSIDEAM